MNTSLGPAFTSAVPLDPLADPLLWELLGSIAVSSGRLEASGQMPVAVALREDLWPSITSLYGYPVVRLARTSETQWGMLV